MRHAVGSWLLVALLALPAVGCEGDDSGDEATAPSDQGEDELANAAKPGDEDDGGEQAAAEAEADRPEACARVIVVAYEDAMGASDDITRSKKEAKARADELRKQVAEGGKDFAELAKAESDAASSGPRGGLIGTYEKAAWPPVHGVVRDPIFSLDVGGLTEVLEAPYGYVFAKRCPVEKVHTRHILIKYEGARRAGSAKRSKQEAEKLAEKVRKEAAADGADFAALAKKYSEGPSAPRGGDLGSVPRGLLAPPYEEAAFALEPGEVSDVVETEFGFHVIKRVE